MKNTKEMNLTDLEMVSGGTQIENPISPKEAKYRELRTAWEELGFPAHGHTRHELDEICSEWEANNFTPSAYALLAPKKDWAI